MSDLNIEDLFKVKIVDKRMRAHIYCTEAYEEYSEKISEEQLKLFLASNQVIYGIQQEIVIKIMNEVEPSQFPLTIAIGDQPEAGENGFVTYTFDENVGNKEKTLRKETNFRDVMSIPSVKENDEIAVETLPTKGEPGKNISGITISPRPGKRKVLRAGKNVRYQKENHTYYATAEGQVSPRANIVEVHDSYIIYDTLSMKTGNVDFVGSVEIHGDVPTGYRVKAGGDIRIFGLVEAATIIAGGSVFISEGFAGLQTGEIIAEGDVHVSYVNQGMIHSNQSIYVENSILHSTCSAGKSITCKRGSIIGGSTTSRYSILAYDIGNRVQTQTRIMIAEDEQVYEEEQKLVEELKSVRKTIKQLKLIGAKLQKNSNLNDAKIRVTHLRQKGSMQQAKNLESEILGKIERLRENFFHDGEATVTIKNELYGNVTIVFGKYERTTQKDYKHVECRFYEKNITISPL